MQEFMRVNRQITISRLLVVVGLALAFQSCDRPPKEIITENSVDVYFHNVDSFNLIDYGIIDSSDVLILEKLDGEWELVNRVGEDIPFGFEIIRGTAVGAMMRVHLSVNREAEGTFSAKNRIVFPGKFITLTSYMTKEEYHLYMDSIKVVAEMHSGELPIRILIQ